MVVLKRGGDRREREEAGKDLHLSGSDLIVLGTGFAAAVFLKEKSPSALRARGPRISPRGCGDED